MEKLTVLLIVFLVCSLPTWAQQPKKVNVTEQEQQALTQAFSLRQQTQAKLAELKKLRESVLQPIEAAIKQAETEDANASMLFQNIELKIGNAHNFDPANYNKTDNEGKLVYVEKPKPDKQADNPKEGK